MALAAEMTNKKMTKMMPQSSALIWVLNGRQSKWLQHGFEFSHAPFHSLSCWSVAPNNKSWRPPNWVWYSQKANKDIIMSLWGRKFGGVIRHFLTLLTAAKKKVSEINYRLQSTEIIITTKGLYISFFFFWSLYFFFYSFLSVWSILGFRQI